MKYSLLGSFMLIAVLARLATGESRHDLYREAIESASRSVVQIRTVGGLQRVGGANILHGPTTGMLVSDDGWIVSSAFNFAQQPSSILVRLPSGKQTPAQLVARDLNRMLVLLKIETDEPLPVPLAVPADEHQVGQTAIALGQAFQTERVNVSVGIISGLRRRYGRVLQTDANISAANYGGPLVDLTGRVFGILVPMSPQGTPDTPTSEVAGAAFYDSGIGFAVPMEHVFAMLPRWKQGDDLLPGILGIGLVDGHAHLTSPKIVSIWPNSPAAEAGWKPGDKIIAVDDRKVTTQAQLYFEVRPRYAGDTVRITIERNNQEIASDVVLADQLATYRHPFFGILPKRISDSDNTPGVVVRSVWPRSPAKACGIKPDDRILKLNNQPIDTLDEALQAIDALHPDDSLSVVVARNDQQHTMTARLATLPQEILSKKQLTLEEASNLETASDKQQQELRPVVQLKLLKLAGLSQPAKFYAPAQKKESPLGLLLWLVDAPPEQTQRRTAAWQTICERDRLVMVFAQPQDSDAGWSSNDVASLKLLVRTARRRWQLDDRRLAVLGVGKGGQLAYALSLAPRSRFSAAVGIDAPLPRTLRVPNNRPGRRLAILAVTSNDFPMKPLIRANLKSLHDAGYPATIYSQPTTGNLDPMLDETTRSTVGRWLRGLDRL